MIIGNSNAIWRQKFQQSIRLPFKLKNSVKMQAILKRVYIVFSCVLLLNGFAQSIKPQARGGGKALIAFVRGNSLINLIAQIYIMDAAGKNVHQITNFHEDHAHASSPAWSPSGKKIAFTLWNSRATNIYVMEANGENVRALTQFRGRPLHPLEKPPLNPSGASGPAWSPDGKKIAFQFYRDASATFEIQVMDTNGENIRQLTNPPRRNTDLYPAFSPDGMKIAFAARREIYSIDIDGQNLRNLTNHPSGHRSPTWSPDGTRIAFTSNRDGIFQIYVMDTDGQEINRLTDGVSYADSPAWFDPDFALHVSPVGHRVTTWGQVKQSDTKFLHK